MITKAEWNAMSVKDKDSIVGASVFKKRATPVMELEGTKYETVVWYWGEGEEREGALPEFTTDRNACALVMDEIEKRSLWWEFTKEFMSSTPIIFYDDFVTDAIPKILRATPDTICYCAVKAVEDAG